MKGSLILLIALLPLFASAQESIMFKEIDERLTKVELAVKAGGAEIRNGSEMVVIGSVLTIVSGAVLAWNLSNDNNQVVNIISASGSAFGIGMTFSGVAGIRRGGIEMAGVVD